MLMVQGLKPLGHMDCFGVFFKQKLENKAFTVVGKGDQKRDFVYVSDVVDAFQMFAKQIFRRNI